MAPFRRLWGGGGEPDSNSGLLRLLVSPSKLNPLSRHIPQILFVSGGDFLPFVILLHKCSDFKLLTFMLYVSGGDFLPGKSFPLVIRY
jgi:hypothetical protein